MRLVDADALVDEIVKINDLRKLSTKTIGNALDAVPTIDAIPVEWIKNRLDAMLKGTASAESCFAVQIMLVDWQKEQEAQDG